MRTAAVDADGRLAGDMTVMPWWSFAKTVLAAAALTLVRDGRAALDETVVGDATLAELLQHCAGLADYGGLAAYHAAVAAGGPAWSETTLLAAVDPTVDRSVWRYSNVGYLHVRRFLERRCDAPLGEVLAERVITPLGIAEARVATRPAEILGMAGIVPGYDPNWVYHGLIVGPVGAAALLLHRLATGSLLPPDLLGAMRAPYPLGAGTQPPWRLPGYGLGLMVERDPPGGFGHTGGGPGSVCAVYHDPVRRITRAAFLPGSPATLIDAPAVVEDATLPASETPR